MFFGANKSMCTSCHGLVQWLGSLTLIVLGVLGLLDYMWIIETPWEMVASIVAIVWGLLVLLNVGCKDCHD